MKHSVNFNIGGGCQKTTKIPNSAQLPTKIAAIHQTSFSMQTGKGGQNSTVRHTRLLLTSQHPRKSILQSSSNAGEPLPQMPLHKLTQNFINPKHTSLSNRTYLKHLKI